MNERTCPSCGFSPAVLRLGVLAADPLKVTCFSCTPPSESAVPCRHCGAVPTVHTAGRRCLVCLPLTDDELEVVEREVDGNRFRISLAGLRMLEMDLLSWRVSGAYASRDEDTGLCGRDALAARTVTFASLVAANGGVYMGREHVVGRRPGKGAP